MKTTILLSILILGVAPVGVHVIGHKPDARQLQFDQFEKEFGVKMSHGGADFSTVESVVNRKIQDSAAAIAVYAGEIKQAEARAKALPANTSGEIETRRVAFQKVDGMETHQQGLIDEYTHLVNVAFDAGAIRGNWFARLFAYNGYLGAVHPFRPPES